MGKQPFRNHYNTARRTAGWWGGSNSALLVRSCWFVVGPVSGGLRLCRLRGWKRGCRAWLVWQGTVLGRGGGRVRCHGRGRWPFLREEKRRRRFLTGRLDQLAFPMGYVYLSGRGRRGAWRRRWRSLLPRPPPIGMRFVRRMSNLPGMPRSWAALSTRLPGMSESRWMARRRDGV